MRHYHGTPIGGQRDQVARFLKGRHALIPWPRPEDEGVAFEVCRGVIFDNGAYTLWKQGGKEPDWKEYIKWCRKWANHPRFDFALIPDVIDGDEDANNELIKFWGKHAWHPHYIQGCPVWHMHESLERLERLCSSAYRHVAIGSSGDWPTPGAGSWWDRIAEAMTVACDNEGVPRRKLHGLRMLAPHIVEALPLSSADSTNVAQNSQLLGRFGNYKPPSQWQRAAVIAERIECVQSPPVWLPGREQQVLFV